MAADGPIDLLADEDDLQADDNGGGMDEAGDDFFRRRMHGPTSPNFQVTGAFHPCLPVVQ